MPTLSVRQARLRRHRRVRGKVRGTVECPRLVVFRSNRGIEAQLVDDTTGKTVAAASWLALKSSFKGDKSGQAAEVGKLLAQDAKHGSTITHEVLGRFDAARVMLRPASDGTGVIAGGGVRAVLELGGVRNVLAKSLGTTNPINMAKATVVALQSLRRPEDVARIRGKQISEVLPIAMIKAKQDVAAASAPATRDAHEETTLASDVPAQTDEP